MSFTDAQKAALAAPLDAKHVAQRSQAGRQLSYIEGWHAIAEANRIFGFDGWNRTTVEIKPLGEPRATKDKYGNDQYRVGYMAKVRVTVDLGEDKVVIREGCGFGSGIDKDPDQAHESALKEAETDAMKRALMTFGNPFGLALYDKSQANVAVVEPEPEKPSGAAELAIGLIQRAQSRGEVQSFYEQNRLAWKSMSAGDQAAIRAAIDEALARHPKEAA